MNYINEHLSALDKNNRVYVHCAGGYRSMIFASMLGARGYRNLVDQRGFKALKDAGKFQLAEAKSPTSIAS